MTPISAIAMLDRALDKSGENIILRRTGTPNIDVTVRALVRPFSPEELIGTISQTDSKVILSPTQITAAIWPTAQPALPAAPYNSDVRVPKVGDKVIIQGRPRNISFAKPILLGGELVRIELQVAG